MENQKDAMRMLYNPKANLILPEYGRNVQQMINICMTIEDRAERNRCARTIINFMGNMFPYLRDVETFKHKLWDHLAIMSDFKLDIDYPFDIIKPETLKVRPEKVPYNRGGMRYMHYGRNMENFVHYIGDHQDMKNREELIKLIASHMKRCYGQFNKDGVDNQKVFDDLEKMSDGKIQTDKGMKLFDGKSNGYKRFNNRQFDNRKK